MPLAAMAFCDVSQPSVGLGIMVFMSSADRQIVSASRRRTNGWTRAGIGRLARFARRSFPRPRYPERSAKRHVTHCDLQANKPIEHIQPSQFVRCYGSRGRVETATTQVGYQCMATFGRRVLCRLRSCSPALLPVRIPDDSAAHVVSCSILTGRSDLPPCHRARAAVEYNDNEQANGICRNNGDWPSCGPNTR